MNKLNLFLPFPSPKYAKDPLFTNLKSGYFSTNSSFSCVSRNNLPKYLPCCDALCAVGAQPLTAQSPKKKQIKK